MKNVVFIVNIKEESRSSRSQPYQYSIASWKEWTKNNDFELFVLENAVYNSEIMNANWHKLMVFDLLEANNIDYDQVLISDADIIIHPDAPNIFNITDNKLCGVAADGSYDWIIRSIENYSKYVFDGYMFPFWKYLNSGMLIVNKAHKKLYKQILDFYLTNHEGIQRIQNTLHVGTDQPIINFFLNMEKVDYKILPYEWIMQDMVRKEILDDQMTFTKLGWIYHYNAIPNNHDASLTYYWMKKTYEYLYNGIS